MYIFDKEKQKKILSSIFDTSVFFGDTLMCIYSLNSGHIMRLIDVTNQSCVYVRFYVSEIVCPVNNVTNARLITENVTSSFLPYLSTIEYECLPGFVLLSGVLINQCLENGNWTSLPTCTGNVTLNSYLSSDSYFLNLQFLMYPFR